jgi:exopolyphosphatase/guanosine-5'-triphosphate,3'-diphosphate pyrophosphatase
MAESVLTALDDGSLGPMPCACIDIGSNTTRLLVADVAADGALRVLAQERHFTRLAAGRAADGTIAAARVGAVAQAVAMQAAIAREVGAGDVVAVATAAVRAAPNGVELCAAIHAACGLEVVVLEPADEAALAFAGATRTLAPAPAGPVAVVDVGGASTELAVGTCAGGVAWSASLPLGSATLAEAELHGDPPPEHQLEAVRARARTALASLDPPPALTGWAVGGSATAVARLLGGGTLSRGAIARAIAAFCCAPAAELADRHGLHPHRARILPAGLIVLDEAAARLGLTLQIAPGGLREGVVLALLDGVRIHGVSR